MENRRTSFVKISGDLLERSEVHEWLRNLADDSYVVICTGGGTQINEAFTSRGWPITFGPMGRETRSFPERQLARDLLEDNQATIQDLLYRQKIPATVVIPVLEIGSVLCHVNGDLYVLAAYLGFDRLYVLTYEERASQKIEEYKKYPKIEVVAFPSKAP